MFLSWRRIVLVILASSLAAHAARAQIPYNLNYDYYPRMNYMPMSYQLYGWSGWGVPPQLQSNITRGVGIYAQAAAARNQAQAKAVAGAQQAQAEQSRMEMLQRWNVFFWQAQHALNLYRVGGKLPEGRREADKAEAELARLRDHPEPAEIESGAALNALLDQVTDPRLPATALRGARTPLDAQLIRQIPYEYSSEIVAIMLDRLTNDTRWPKPLNMPALAESRASFRSAVDGAMKENERGPLSEETVRAVHQALKDLVVNVGKAVPRNSQLATSAEGYMKELTGVARLLGKPDVRPVLDALNDKSGATMEDLISFMEMFSLHFGQATTPEQKEAYKALYPKLMRWRSDLAKRTGRNLPQGGVTLQALRKEAAPALLIFATMSWDQLLGRTAPGAAAPAS
jgi:hypothetical protein